MNKQLSVFTNDISSVLDSSTKSKPTQSCLNKQQDCVQYEIRKLNKDYPTNLRGAHLNVQNVPNIQKNNDNNNKKNRQMNKEMAMSLLETQMLAYFFQSDTFSYVRSFVDAKEFLIS